MINKPEFRIWLINRGMAANTAASVCSRVNRIKEAYDIENEYAKDRCAELLEDFTYTAHDAKAGTLPNVNIVINGSYLTGLKSLKKALEHYVEYLYETFVPTKTAKQLGKRFYLGDFEGFKTYIGPKCRNLVQALTRSKKVAIAACECCAAPKTLEAAHIHGFERNDVIKGILDKYYKQGPDNYKVDLVDFEDRFKDAHDPLENVFYFLCKGCHNQYDGSDAKKVQAVVDAVRLTRKSRVQP